MVEKSSIMISDPTGMDWLELHDPNNIISDRELNGFTSLPAILRNVVCEQKCPNYKKCGGVQSLTLPYNRLQKEINGVSGTISPNGCALRNTVFPFTVGY